MTGWTSEDLRRIARSDEIGVATRRADGTVGAFVTIWAVRVGEDLYVRSAHGLDNPWFQRALRSGLGRIRAGGAAWDVAFEAATPVVGDEVTVAYHAKYDRYGPRIVGSVVSDEARRATLRVTPA